MIENNPFHFKLENVKPLAGFVAENIGPGQVGKVLARGFVNSDQKEFYEYTNQISSLFLGQRYLIDTIHTFLILIHPDLSADVYVNLVPIELRILAKGNLKPGNVSIRQIADVEALEFDGIDVLEKDSIIFCFKKGWKFGLFFDFNQILGQKSMDLQALQEELGSYYKYLMFQEEYAVLENEAMFSRMFQDGWFPFIQLLGGEFKELARIYEGGTNLDSDIGTFITRFDRSRLDSFVQHWWRNEIFRQKEPIIMSGIEAYLMNNQAGFINAIKTLYSEIEGIIRITYTKETGKNPSFQELIDYINQKARVKFGSRISLGFPGVFFDYIREHIFKSFDLASGQVDLSRHSASHGVAEAKDYTKNKALQAVLVLDQMSFYLT